MEATRFSARFPSVLGVLLVFSCPLLASNAPVEEPTYRALRSDYVKTWHIFNDSNLDGILDPGDTRVSSMQNWWTPVSAHTQHNYDYHGYGDTYGPTDDIPSGPMNFATHQFDPGDPNNTASYNYWLPKKPGAISFYMSYSQFDNNDFATYYGVGGAGRDAVTTNGVFDQDKYNTLFLRNQERNGWSMGWVNNSIVKDANGQIVQDQSHGGHVEMAIYVHNGKGNVDVPGWGTSLSNPQVALSNDIDYSAKNSGGSGSQWHTPIFNDATGTMMYDPNSAANQAYMATLDDGSADFNTIVNSMEIQERDPLNMPGSMSWLGRTPEEILAAGLVDHDGNAYEYQDAFSDISDYAAATSDGGVIAGLAGQSNYNSEDNNWGDQQVIRIDISEDTLRDITDGGKISEIIFYDFGENTAEGAGQTSPYEILIGVDLSRTVAQGQLFLKDPITGDPLHYFPENRIYIAQVATIPEPATMVLVALGGVGMLLRRRRSL